MSELTSSRKHHGDPVSVRRGGDLLVTDGAARLNDCRDARLGGLLDAVGKGEERIGGEDGSLRLMPGVAGLVDRKEGGVDPAHLAGSDTDRRLIFGQEDRV